LHALKEFGVAIADPIAEDTPAELRGARLEAISEGVTEGVIISNQKFSQIALLQPELFNRCQEGVEEAEALLGLVLCYVAPQDPEKFFVHSHMRGTPVGSSSPTTARHSCDPSQSRPPLDHVRPFNAD
jgi:hypothetical protein